MTEDEKGRRLAGIREELWRIATNYNSGDDNKVGVLQAEALRLGAKYQLRWVAGTARYTVDGA